MSCPNCGSDRVVRKGTRAGKQRYRCNSCGAAYTEGVPYEKAIIQDKVKGIECPVCGSVNIRRDGKDNSTQRYCCKDCGRNFNSKSKERLELRKIVPNCPYCGAKLKYSGYGKKGTRTFDCPSCGKHCTADENGKPVARIFFKDQNTSVKCPSCGSFKLARKGRKGSGGFKCQDCGKFFKENPKFTVHSKDEQNIVIRLLLAGKNPHKICEKYKYNLSRLQHMMSRIYEKEVISEKQKADIIKYGYYLRVPVDYMAEYVKCSEHKCREVLKEYRKQLKLKSTNC